jgi:hypothetical protein
VAGLNPQFSSESYARAVAGTQATTVTETIQLKQREFGQYGTGIESQATQQDFGGNWLHGQRRENLLREFTHSRKRGLMWGWLRRQTQEFDHLFWPVEHRCPVFNQPERPEVVWIINRAGDNKNLFA